ncbi:MAG: TMEM175 family protein [Pseudanabaena sp. CAN_BIN31]|nr:TMEM175 family protein [Pseudanabaena sp. CAN_BIN31]
MKLISGSRNTAPYEYLDNDISNRRIETLVDGVFAIALTLLALDLLQNSKRDTVMGWLDLGFSAV